MGTTCTRRVISRSGNDDAILNKSMFEIQCCFAFSFYYKYGLANIVEHRLASKLKMRKCNECHKTFASLSALNRHIQHHTGKYTHFCSACRKGYNNSYNLHIMGHEGKGFPCKYCGKLFKTIQSKQYHESEHTGCTDSNAPLVIKDKGVQIQMLLL